jgi:hypothetical protein
MICMKAVVISIANRNQEAWRPAERLHREALTPIPNTPITIKPGSLSAAKLHPIYVAEQSAPKGP